MKPRHLRSFVFNSFWIQLISESMNALISHSFGRCSLTNPFVFSLVPSVQGIVRQREEESPQTFRDFSMKSGGSL